MQTGESQIGQITNPKPARRYVRRLIELTSHQQPTQRASLDWLRVEYGIEKPSTNEES